MPNAIAKYCVAWLFASCGLLSGTAQAIVSTTNATSQGGTGQSFLDGVAKLLITRSDGTFGCSGSLLAGGAHVLTAAHCVSGDTGLAGSSAISVSFLGGSLSATGATYTVHPGWNGSVLDGNDLAVIRLASNITTVNGYGLHTGNAVNNTVVLAGYGLTGNGVSGTAANTFGTLHFGYNQYDGASYRFNGEPAMGTYLYDFDDGSNTFNKFGSLGLGSAEAFIAPGDSGGPSLIQLGGQWLVAGVHSFSSCRFSTCPINSSFGEVGGDTSVSAQAAWLQSVVGPVPEPHSYAMLLLGLGLIAGMSKRRRC